MKLFQSCTKAGNIFCSSLDETGLMEGVTDVIVVKHKSGELRSTKFFACVGSYMPNNSQSKIQLFINKKLINQVKMTLDQYGYITPNNLSSVQLQKLGLKLGKNKLEYKVQQLVIPAQIYLYTDNDRLLVSDVDGTVTKTNVGGLYNNYMGSNYLHDGYTQLVSKVADNGYKIVWMTMRSLPLYEFSKKYIEDQVGVEGPLLMQPQQFFHAFKKQLLKEAANIKANIMKDIQSIFPTHINPFAGGLGNMQTDAIAYKYAGISNENIYIIDVKSEVHKLNNKEHALTYHELAREIQIHFPKYSSPKIGYF